MWPSTLRWRLTLWYGVGLGVPLIAFAAGCYFLFSRALLERTDGFIDDALTAFTRELGAERRLAEGVVPAMRTTVSEVRFADLRIGIIDSAGGLLAGITTRASGGAGYRVRTRPLVLEQQRYTLVGAYPLDDMNAVLARLRDIFALLVPLLIACSAAGGYFLARRSLGPMASMASRAALLSANNPDERLPVAGGEELSGLARVVNDLLDRLHASFAQQRRFMADASHELRTPTAILRAEADVSLSQPHRNETEYRASLVVMREAAGRLTRIVEDLFLLARVDAGSVQPRREPVQLEDLLVDIARSVRPLADQRQVNVALPQLIEAPIQGDEDLLGRALLNVLDNAIKHAPAGSTVSVSLASRDGCFEIDVADAGPGIPADAHARIFERFFRVDPARARGEQSATSGAGLGLPIGRRIAELHGGWLDVVESRPGHTVFRITLPPA